IHVGPKILADTGSLQSCQSHPCTCRNGNIRTSSLIQHLSNCASTVAGVIKYGGDASETNLRHAQQHEQGSEIIGIAAEIGIKVIVLHVSLRSVVTRLGLILMTVSPGRHAKCVTREALVPGSALVLGLVPELA